jgi:hypothetical protein
VLFTAGQNLLQSHDRDIAEVGRIDMNGREEPNPNAINKFKLNVLTNAVCVDILVWAARDEQGKMSRDDLKKQSVKAA